MSSPHAGTRQLHCFHSEKADSVQNKSPTSLLFIIIHFFVHLIFFNYFTEDRRTTEGEKRSKKTSMKISSLIIYTQHIYIANAWMLLLYKNEITMKANEKNKRNAKTT